VTIILLIGALCLGAARTTRVCAARHVRCAFDDIASIVGCTPVAARQLASRARRKVRGTELTPDVDLGRQRKVVNTFLDAVRRGDFEVLLEVPQATIFSLLRPVINHPAPNDGTSKLIDFSRGDDPKAIADYPQLPWYPGSARLGDLFLKLDPTNSVIQVSLFGKSQLL
jgi:hypothetical protein